MHDCPSPLQNHDTEDSNLQGKVEIHAFTSPIQICNGNRNGLQPMDIPEWIPHHLPCAPIDPKIPHHLPCAPIDNFF